MNLFKTDTPAWKEIAAVSLHQWIIVFPLEVTHILSTIPPCSPTSSPSSPPKACWFTVLNMFDIAFIMTRRFWSLKHKSDVMQWAHGAWRLLTSSSKIRLWCKKTSKCVRCQINSFLKDTDTQFREQTHFIDDSSWCWKYDTGRFCFF